MPGTTYNKSVQAVNAIEDKLYPVVFEALKDEKSLLESDLILGRLMKSLQAEGAEIMFTGDAEKKADFFCSEVIGLMFGGTLHYVQVQQRKDICGLCLRCGQMFSTMY